MPRLSPRLALADLPCKNGCLAHHAFKPAMKGQHRAAHVGHSHSRHVQCALKVCVSHPCMSQQVECLQDYSSFLTAWCSHFVRRDELDLQESQSQRSASIHTQTDSSLSQAAKQAMAAALASLQIAAIPFVADLVLPAPAQAVLNSPNARIARRCSPC